MSRHSLACVFIFTFALISAANVVAAQKPKDQSAATEPSTTRENRMAKIAKISAVRMPRYYGKLELDGTQRDKIRELQSQFNERIGELRKQIETIEIDRDREVEAVLKAEQKKRLMELKSAVVRSPIGE